MNALETLRNAVPDAAKDLRLNLGSVLQPGALTKEQVWGTAVACAIAVRNPQLRQATLEDALLLLVLEHARQGYQVPWLSFVDLRELVTGATSMGSLYSRPLDVAVLKERAKAWKLERAHVRV